VVTKGLGLQMAEALGEQGGQASLSARVLRPESRGGSRIWKAQGIKAGGLGL